MCCGCRTCRTWRRKPVAVRADFHWPKADKRRSFCACGSTRRAGWTCSATRNSGVLTSAAWGDGVVDNPAGQTIAPGDVQFIAFSELLG